MSYEFLNFIPQINSHEQSIRKAIGITDAASLVVLSSQAMAEDVSDALVSPLDRHNDAVGKIAVS